MADVPKPVWNGMEEPCLKNGTTSTRDGAVHSQSCPGLTSLLLIQCHTRRRLPWKTTEENILFSSLKQTFHIPACMQAAAGRIQNENHPRKCLSKEFEGLRTKAWIGLEKHLDNY